MKINLSQCSGMVFAAALVIAAGCAQKQPALSAEEQQELQQLREQNKQIQKLRTANRELDRLRKDNQELNSLRSSPAEIARLRIENTELRNQMAALPASRREQLRIPPPDAPAPIANLVQAFDEAAAVVASQGFAKPEDIPQEGDQIFIDQSVIGMMLPEFAGQTNAQQFELSGWLKSKGITLQNYQQFSTLGITNYHIRRTGENASQQIHTIILGEDYEALRAAAEALRSR